MYQQMLSAGEYDSAAEYDTLLALAKDEFEVEVAREEYEKEVAQEDCRIDSLMRGCRKD